MKLHITRSRRFMKKSKWLIPLYVIISCIIMAVIEIVVEPNYLIKSIIKIILFFVIPFILIKLTKIKILDNFKVNKKDIFKLLKIGIIIYIVGIISYLILKNFFDFTKLTNSGYFIISFSKLNNDLVS